MSHILFLCCQSFVLDLPYAFQLHVKVFSNLHFISSYGSHTVTLQVLECILRIFQIRESFQALKSR